MSDRRAGIERVRWGRGFRYRTASGRWLRDAATLERIRALAIPPAWTSVWICPDPRGHLQATGTDARGRKQYRYHPRWTARRSRERFERLFPFGEALPALRRRVRRDLRRPGLPRRKVLACVVRLLDETWIRVGNREYLARNGSRGLTTLAGSQVRLEGARIEFDFRGKGGRRRSLAVEDAAAADVLRRCRRLPRRPLFQFVDEAGAVHRVDSARVLAYLRSDRAPDRDAKDFRAWGASVCFAERLLADGGEPEAASRRARKRAEMVALRHVAARLGNTPAVARRSYVHPALLDAWATGELARCRDAARRARRSHELSLGEETLLRLGETL